MLYCMLFYALLPSYSNAEKTMRINREKQNHESCTHPSTLLSSSRTLLGRRHLQLLLLQKLLFLLLDLGLDTLADLARFSPLRSAHLHSYRSANGGGDDAESRLFLLAGWGTLDAG